MKVFNFLNSAKKRLLAGAIIALAVAVPVSQAALAASVSIEGTMGVANKTAGDTAYTSSVNAKYNDVVKIEVYYHNRELPDSGKIAQNLRMKIAIPSTAGKTQTQTATISGDNTNTVTAKTTVNLDRADASLQYLPGSAVWRHNIGTNDKPNWVDTVISDNIVTSGTGLVLENEKPCYNFSATVTVLARVMVPGVSIDKYARVKGTSQWARSITAQPGQTVQYEIAYKNTGNTTQKDVAIRDQLPKGITYVPGTAQLMNGNFPNGTKISDAIVTNGVVTGDYLPGAAGYVMFEATVPSKDNLACGDNNYRNIGYVQPSGMNYYYNTADVTVHKDCAQTPVYTCDSLTLVKGDNRTVNATVKYTAQNGATYKNTTLVWGDSNQSTITGTTGSHQYAKDGTYTVNANMLFTVNGTDKAPASNPACSQTVTFSTTGKTPSVKIEKLVEGVKSKEVTVGNNYTYTVKVTNDGEVDLVNAAVTDTPADGTNIQLLKADKGTITGNTWNYTIPSLKVGQSQTFTLTAKVTKSTDGDLVNTACVNAKEVNPQHPDQNDACDTAKVHVKKPVTPAYTCDALTVTTGANRSVTAKVGYTGTNGASLKMVTYNWGDGTTPLVTNATSANYQYQSDGTFTISVRLLFTVNGKDIYAADNASCQKTVTFGTTTPTTPEVLPNTGAGSMVGLIGFVSVISALAYRLFLGRRLARK